MSEEPPRKFSRANRGARMHLLMGEQEETGGKGTEIRGGNTQIGEMQGEAITYNDYFNESSDEGSYVESSEEEDYVDSDFVTDDDNDDEEDDDDAEQDIAQADKAERKKAKKAAYVDPAKRTARTSKASGEEFQVDDAAAERGEQDRRHRRRPGGGAALDAGGAAGGGQDHSRPQREGPAAAGADRGGHEEGGVAQARAHRGARRGPLAQGPLLHLLLRPCLRPRSQLGGEGPPAPPPKAVCAITGKPAKYLDPKTGEYYATLEAFKKLRATAAA